MSKYNAKRVKRDGYTFDSKAEAKRYWELKQLEKEKEIAFLEVHPKFVLQPAFTYRGLRVRQITYSADFKYREGNKIVVEDVKGGRATMTQLFCVKWKMAKYQNPTMDFRIVQL